MAQGIFDFDLQNTQFPLLAEQQGRTYINTKEQSKLPVIAYCHNVMPVAQGMQSVGYDQLVAAIPGLPETAYMTDLRTLFSTTKVKTFMAWGIDGSARVIVEGGVLNTWQDVTINTVPPRAWPVEFDVNCITLGTVNGVSYVFYKQFGCFTYDSTTFELNEVEMVGLSLPTILGIVASAGYLIAHTELAVAWSSTIDPLDFVPSQVTGAGGGNVAGIAGDIAFITPNTLGILVYTQANIIAGTYTGNAQYPFKFREVEDSQSAENLDLVTYEANSASQYIISRSGVQAVSSQRAEGILPEVTDFLANGRFEDYDTTTHQFTRVTTGVGSNGLKRKIKLIAGRYLIVSYGLPTLDYFTHALVYDKVSQKLGKLKISHTDIFDYSGRQEGSPRGTIAFLLGSGNVSTTDLADFVGTGVIILGKVGFSASRLTTLQGVELDNITVGGALDVRDQSYLDGKNFTDIAGIEHYRNGRLKEYAFRNTAQGHSIVVIGQFTLVSCRVRYSLSGRR